MSSGEVTGAELEREKGAAILGLPAQFATGQEVLGGFPDLDLLRPAPRLLDQLRQRDRIGEQRVRGERGTEIPEAGGAPGACRWRRSEGVARSERTAGQQSDRRGGARGAGC